MMILEAPPLDGEQEPWALELVLALQPTSLEKGHQVWGLGAAASSQNPLVLEPWSP